MGKIQPPGTVTHTVFLPTELHKKVSAVAPDGQTADDIIVECVKEAMEKRWKDWLAQEAKKEGCELVSNKPRKSRAENPH